MAKCDPPHSPVLQIAIDIPLDKIFDYRAPNDGQIDIKPGARVLVPFANRQRVGVVVARQDTSDFDPSRLKTVLEVLDPEPLIAAKDLKLLEWASRYYHHPLGEVLAIAFPVALRKGKPAVLQLQPWIRLTAAGTQIELEQLRRAAKQQELVQQLQITNEAMPMAVLNLHKPALQALLRKGLVEECRPPTTVPQHSSLPSPLQANAEQQAAIDTVIGDLGRFSVSLLQGVTGSGKTEVYMQIIAECLRRNLQVLVLLPEITLTPQLEQRFRQRFLRPIVCSHSKLNDSERLQAWLNMQQGKASILLGTRSALFTPLPRPGLIILDEEHDSSFKQQEGFRFSCRDVAIARGKMLNIPVLLGSATPALETLFNVQQQRYRLLQLTTRAGNAVEPQFQVLDIRNKGLQAGLSETLIKAIHSTLEQQQQVLLFLNRRGFAPVQICHGCGWVARCQRCDANLVIHASERRLRCHHCGSEQALSKLCPACSTGELQPLGMGTERIEQTLSALFPDKTIVRLDRDTTQRKGSLEDFLAQIYQGHADIILGTQMLAKGHHFPEVTLVAILDIDSGLFSIDFRAGERLAQLISQVAGRAGRADKAGRVILQTRQPQHPLLTTLLDQGYAAFAELALRERQQAGLPPFSYQALLRVHAGTSLPPQQFLQAVLAILKQHKHDAVSVLGPVSAPMARRAGQFRFQLLLQSRQRKALHSLLEQLLPGIYQLSESKKVCWSLDVDPLDLY